MYMVIYLFCKLAFPQLTTFLVFYGKRLCFLSCLLIWSHFPFPILLLKTVVRYWDSSCLGEEWFPMGQCPLLVTVICCCMMWFSPILGVHIKALGVFIVSAEDIESRGRSENTHSLKKLLQLIDVTGFQIWSAHHNTVNTKDGVTFTVKDQKSLFMTFFHSRITATARALFACLSFIQLVIHS